MAELVCTVASLVPFEIREEKPGLVPPRFYLEASDTKTPKVLLIGDAKHFVYLDESRGHLTVKDSCVDVAASVVNDYISSQLEVTEDARPGLFYVIGEFDPVGIMVAKRDKVAQAQRLQNNWFLNVCRVADDDWNKYHRHNVVSDFQRKAAQLLGWKPEEHEWMSGTSVINSVRCPSCSTLIGTEVVVCPSCKCILNPEKYKTLQFA